MILLATCPVTLVLANNSNSHARAWGSDLWDARTDLVVAARRMVARVIAGLLLGIAVTIRYTEGLLLLPLVLACAMTVRWKFSQIIPECRRAAPGVVGAGRALLLFNKLAMGSWTGYDTTNESTGFTLKDFQDKWEFMLNQLHSGGLFFIMPIAIFGLGLMFRWSWRLALLMTAWFVPGVLLYTSYYWGNEKPGIAYLRFFLTLFPPVIFAAAWMFYQCGMRNW